MTPWPALPDNPVTRRTWQALLWAGVLLAAWLAFGPRPVGDGPDGLDKLQHLAAFACLAFAATLSLPPHWPTVARAGAWLLAYGVLIEAVQAFLPGRTASLADVLADALGIVVGVALAQALRRRPVAIQAHER